MQSSSTSAKFLCLFVLLGCIATSTATEPKIENNFDTSSIGSWPRWWWRTHPKLQSPLTQSPSPIDNVVSPTHMAPSPVDDVIIAFIESPHTQRGYHFSLKVRNYCSLAFDNDAPSPSPIDNAALPTHASPSPSLDDNSASPTHVIPSPSTVDDVISPSHNGNLLRPAPCSNYFFHQDDCFYREYMHSKRVPFFLGKERKYCGHYHA
ncbi:hypothetical protein EJD97_023911 [Solanum chilense]|uniref:Uncharacterized protein n=1 Tax=Solanum chilense TaxID=4083 RepID=A0A6N2ATI6_SOLCI|nr:hypothetical protein EJD97_023911 [Solanum chilense]